MKIAKIQMDKTFNKNIFQAKRGENVLLSAGAGKGKCRGYISPRWSGPAGGILPLILPPGQKQLRGGLISATSG